MSDKLVFDLAQEVEGTPNVFVRKDWINILDNQNQNYNNNQSVVDTSQLSNSNKYMSYRESYFLIPLILTLESTASQGTAGGAYANAQPFLPTNPEYSADSAIGLKNWFGQIIHSFTLDYNGTTIIQQTPYVNMWNSFKLMTSLSMSDVRTQGSVIGFYPDDPKTFTFTSPTAIAARAAGAGAGQIMNVLAYSLSGQGTCNNTNYCDVQQPTYNQFNYSSGLGNKGLARRISYINFDGDAVMGAYTAQFQNNTGGAAGLVSEYVAYRDLVNGAPGPVTTACNQVWKSYIYNKVDCAAGGANGIWQCAITACVYLKHVHSFFNMCPLLKGVFMKMTLNLNNTSTSFSATSFATAAANPASSYSPWALECTAVQNPFGGVSPIMIASADASNTVMPIGPGFAAPVAVAAGNYYPYVPQRSGTAGLFYGGLLQTAADANGRYCKANYRVNLSVGGRCLDQTMTGPNTNYQAAPLAQSIYLYIPAYTFNPVFEQAYLSSPVKQIKYTDIYQYQVQNVSSGNNFNNLLTNGIANIKSVLILPFYSAVAGAQVAPAAAPTQAQPSSVLLNSNTGFLQGVPVWQSPFDPAGTGPTSPMTWISNFNIQVSGQNAIYNLERYNFEQWNNQLYGQNAVNGGLTDGLTSGLIDRVGFDMEYCYYYVNVERMLPVEQSVPKSIQILGQNFSSKALDLYCFIEYGVDISIDALTGARV